MKYVIFILSITLLSCNNKKDKKLNFALEFAGENKHELEEVLDHYENNSEKRAAAKFLIENMPYHYYSGYVKTKDYYNVLDVLDSLNNKKEIKTLTNKNQLFPKLEYTTKNDARTLKASYLIKNIDLAYDTWKKQPWGKFITFDQFCREILPYRIGNEVPDNWREIYYNHFQPILDSLLTDENPVSACKIIYNSLTKDKWIFMPELSSPRLGGEILFKYRIGNCREYSDIATYAMRAVGLPGGVDLILQNPDKIHKVHYWNYVKDTTGKSLEFELFKGGPSHGYQDSTRKRGKVYRYSFDIQSDHLDKYKVSKKIPERLNDPFLLDISNAYYPGYNITIPINNTKEDLLFLCVFNNSSWIPITAVEINDNHAEFKGVESEIVYLPAFYKNNKIYPLSSPFLYKKNKEIHYFTPDTTQRITVTLTRKYFQSHLWYDSTYVINGKFEASNTPDFKQTTNLYTITKNAEMKFNEVNTLSDNEFRYARYITPDTNFNLMAEVEFYNEKYELLKGKTIGTEGVEGDDPQLSKNAVFDGDPLTYFRFKSPEKAWAGLDLGEKHTIDKIRFIFRNDDNQIKEGEIYELFYFNIDGNPVSLGKQIGIREQLLIYNNVPSNALLWLRNLTKGKEERIFTYEDDKQIWW